MLYTILYFPNSMRSAVNHLLSAYPKLVLIVVVLTFIKYRNEIWTILMKRFSGDDGSYFLPSLTDFQKNLAKISGIFRSKELEASLSHELTDIQKNDLHLVSKKAMFIRKKISALYTYFKDVVTGAFLIGGGRFITSAGFHLFRIKREGNEPNTDGTNIRNTFTSDEWILFVEQLDITLEHLAFVILTLIIISGFFYTISFGNKVFKGMGSFFLALAFLIFLGGFFFASRSMDLHVLLGTE